MPLTQFTYIKSGKSCIKSGGGGGGGCRGGVVDSMLDYQSRVHKIYLLPLRSFK